MRLTATDLRQIANALEELAKTTIVVESFVVGRNRVTVKFIDDQKDGRFCYVNNIDSTWNIIK